MNKFNFLIILLFLSIFSSLAQSSSEKAIDSLISTLTKENGIHKIGQENYFELCTRIYDQSEIAKYEKGKLLVRYYQITTHYNLGNVENSQALIDDGIKLATKLKDYSKTGQFLNIDGYNLMYFNQYDKARNQYQKALSISNLIKESEEKHNLKTQVYLSIASLFHYSNNNHTDSISYFTNLAYLESQKLINTPYEAQIAQTANFMGLDFIDQNKLEEAIVYLDEAASVRKKYPHLSFIEIQEKEGRAKIEHLRKDYNKAIAYYLEAIELAKKTNHDYLVTSLYTEIIEVYRTANLMHEVDIYSSKLIKLKDSLSKIEKKAIFEKLESKKIEKKPLRSIWLIYIVLFILFIVAIIYTKIRKNRLLSQEKDTTNISEADEKEGEPINDLIRLAKNNDPGFQIKFEELFPDVIEKLLKKNPKLTNDDLRFCGMLYLNFSTKEIARFIFVEPKTVQMRKYRIRKKLNISKGKDINLWMKEL